MPLRPRLRGASVRGAGAVALRELSRGVAPAAAADAAARRRGLRVRARRRRHRRRRHGAAGRAAGAARRVAAAACTRRVAGGRRPDAPRRDDARRSDCRRARRIRSARSICRSRCSTISLSAFGQDTMTTRYASWADVLDYCRRSANPVGRLVLRIAGYRDEALDRSSDALCTALQLTNFWQDFGRDWRAGRLYVPREVQAACGAREADLAGGRIDAGVGAGDRTRASRVTRDAFRRGPRRLRRRRRPPARSSCASPGSAARGSSSASNATGADLLEHRPTLGARRRARAALARRCAGQARAAVMARKTSFYYSFLVLPADQRRAIIAVWDFCRAVDDAVDESRRRRRVADRPRGRGVLARRAGARATTARRRRRRRASACSRSSAASTCRGRRSRT